MGDRGGWLVFLLAGFRSGIPWAGRFAGRASMIALARAIAESLSSGSMASASEVLVAVVPSEVVAASVAGASVVASAAAVVGGVAVGAANVAL